MTEQGKPCWYCDNTRYKVVFRNGSGRCVCTRCGTSVSVHEIKRTGSKVKAGRK